MLRVVLGGLLAAVVVTVYLLASWLLIGTHRPTHKPLPEEWDLVSENGNLLVTDGVYVSVPLPTAKLSVPVDQQIETLTSFRTACTQGPLITVFYRRHGIDPLRSLMPVKILLVNLAAAWVAAVVLYLGQISFAAYFQRVLVVVLLGVFAGLTGHGWEHAWLSFDLQFSLLMAGDVVVGWLLGGLVLAAIVKEPPFDPNIARPLLMSAGSAPPVPKAPVVKKLLAQPRVTRPDHPPDLPQP